MFGNRVITNAIIVAGSLLAFGFFAGEANAQYESVGKPLQLVPQAYSSGSSATPRARVAAKKAARAETRAEIRSETRSAVRIEPKTEPKTETSQHISFRRKHPAHNDVAEQKRFRRPATVASAETPAARTPLPVRAASTAPAPPLPPQAAPAPVQPSSGDFMVEGQAVQVRSPDEANELDLAANTDSSVGGVPPRPLRWKETTRGSAKTQNPGSRAIRQMRVTVSDHETYKQYSTKGSVCMCICSCLFP